MRTNFKFVRYRVTKKEDYKRNASEIRENQESVMPWKSHDGISRKRT